MGTWIGNRSQKHGIHNAEDGCGRTYTERQRQDSTNQKRRLACEDTKCKADVLWSHIRLYIKESVCFEEKYLRNAVPVERRRFPFTPSELFLPSLLLPIALG